MIKDEFGFDVPVLVKTIKELKQIDEKNPFENEKLQNSYYCLFYEKPNPELVKDLREISLPNEEFLITDSCIYLYYLNGAGRAKMTNNFLERKLKLIATTRNYRTIQKLLTLSAEE